MNQIRAVLGNREESQPFRDLVLVSAFDEAAMSEGDPISAAVPRLNASHCETAGPLGGIRLSKRQRVKVRTTEAKYYEGSVIDTQKFDGGSNRDRANSLEGGVVLPVNAFAISRTFKIHLDDPYPPCR